MEKCNNPKAYILSMSGRIVYDARTGVIEDSPNWRVQPLRTKSATRRVMTNQEIAEVDDYFEELAEECAQMPQGVGEEEYLVRITELTGGWDGAA